MRKDIRQEKERIGNCFYEIVWDKNNKNVLIISPVEGTNGLLFHRDPFHPDIWEWHWKGQAKDIKKVIIKKGVTAGEHIDGLFFGFSSCHDFDIGNMDTSKVISMKRMFLDCYFLTDIDGLRTWNTENLEDTTYMFGNCCSLEDVSPIKGWNTAKVKRMGAMFKGCSSLTDASPLSSWDVRDTETRYNMFEECPSTDPFQGIPLKEHKEVPIRKKGSTDGSIEELLKENYANASLKKPQNPLEAFFAFCSRVLGLIFI